MQEQEILKNLEGNNNSKNPIERAETKGEITCDEFENTYNVHHPVISEVQSNFNRFRRIKEVKMIGKTSNPRLGEHPQLSL